MSVINGFLVVRLPSLAFDAAGRGAFSPAPKKVGDLFYGGLGRMPWFDVEEDFFNHTLPGDIQNLFMRIRDANNDFSGLPICKDVDEATSILKFSNRNERRNELIAIHSQLLDQVKGSIDFDDGRLVWLGFDIVSLGNWSLLSNGYFCKPELFRQFAPQLNREGLFSREDAISEFVNAYQQYTSDETMEPLPQSCYGIGGVRIARVT